MIITIVKLDILSHYILSRVSMDGGHHVFWSTRNTNLEIDLQMIWCCHFPAIKLEQGCRSRSGKGTHAPSPTLKIGDYPSFLKKILMFNMEAKNVQYTLKPNDFFVYFYLLLFCLLVFKSYPPLSRPLLKLAPHFLVHSYAAVEACTERFISLAKRYKIF